MPICDFSPDSYCAKLANLDTDFGSAGQINVAAFLNVQQNGYNNFNGCQWIQGRINAWQGAINNSPPITNPATANPHQWRIVAKRRAKVEWGECMMITCCPGNPNSPPWNASNFGCMDDGLRDQGYLNNQGTLATPQYGSVTPNTPALNFDSLAVIDDGSCVYPPNAFPPYTQAGLCGCKDSLAYNYDANATFDCDCNYISPFNINWTRYDSWGVSLNGSSIPSFPYQTGPGDTSCCGVKRSLENSRTYDYRMQSGSNPGGMQLSTRNPGGAIQGWAIGGQYLWAWFNRFDIVGNETFNSYYDLLAKGTHWPGTFHEWTPATLRFRVRVYSIEEELIYDGIYSAVGASLGTCGEGHISGEHCWAKLNNLTLVNENFSITPGNIIDLEPYAIWTNTYFPQWQGLNITYDGLWGQPSPPIASGPAGYIRFDWPLAGTTIDRSITGTYGIHTIYPNHPSPLAIKRGQTNMLALHWTGNKRVFTQVSPLNVLYSPFPGNYLAPWGTLINPSMPQQTGFTWPHSCSDCNIASNSPNNWPRRNMMQYPLVGTASGSLVPPAEQDPNAWIPAHDAGWFTTAPFDSSTLTWCGSMFPFLGPGPSSKLSGGTCLNGGEIKSFSLKSTYLKDDNHEVTITPGININLTKR